MITDEMLLPFVPMLCGMTFMAFMVWVAWALWGSGNKYPNSQLEAERQAAERAWEEAHPSWVERKHEYLLTHGVPAEYITDPRVVKVDGFICDEWPTPNGVILSKWQDQDQDPRWKEPAHG